MEANNLLRKISFWPELAALLGVLAFAYFSYAGLVKKGQKAPVAKAPEISRPAPSRSLASVANLDAKPEKSTVVLELGCLSDKKFSTQAGMLRVTGKICGRSNLINGRNDTTDESLQIFQMAQEFTTHYFPLKEGQNHIVLQVAEKKYAIEVSRAFLKKK